MYTAAGGVLRFNHKTENEAELTDDDLVRPKPTKKTLSKV